MPSSSSFQQVEDLNTLFMEEALSYSTVIENVFSTDINSNNEKSANGFILDTFRNWCLVSVTAAGIHKEMVTGSKFLLMKEADLSLTNLGYYNQGSSAGSTARAVLCEAFDGYKRSSKTTGGYGFQIEKSELFLLGGTTGANMTSILFKYAARGICDGCENRFFVCCCEKWYC
ncbi:unnamed protein product [Didymodactylos carnosus]|uniref:Uncharacterized protein n=1 Tax=Didymodactylos carnosus TaxID=1234261 RepID=A0A815C0Q7_9BILA|nr:unnamed protein product [Didymodactylos carnosus]CAF4072531.1 unnamed protein product [Didymodactylos carnosus]